jgi:hypothetical protein
MVSIIETSIQAGRGAHLVVCGYGGIGKTAVALAVCHHPTIRALFGPLRLFVECDMAEKPELLLQEIASRLGIQLSEGNTHALVIAALKAMSSTQPLLLILDSAESFLDSSSLPDGKEINDILSDISAIPNITLVLTKRGSEHPLAVKWDALQELDTLSLEAARQIFISIAGTAMSESDHGQVESLLKALDCVPLAVTLLSRVAQSGGSASLESFHQGWKRRMTDLLLLHGGDDNGRETSISASIEVSLRSRLMEENAYAKRLLSIICYLPEGIFKGYLVELSNEWGVDASEAAELLMRLSLAHEQPNGHFLTTLSPIRQHVSRNHPVIGADLDLVLRWHLDPANRNDHISSEDIVIQQRNIISVLRRHISPAISQSARPPIRKPIDLWGLLEHTIDYRELRSLLATESIAVGEPDSFPFDNSKHASPPSRPPPASTGANKSASMAMDWSRYIMADLNAYVGGGGYADVFRGKWMNVPGLDETVLQKLPKLVVKKFRIDEASMEEVGESGERWNKRVSHLRHIQYQRNKEYYKMN